MKGIGGKYDCRELTLRQIGEVAREVGCGRGEATHPGGNKAKNLLHNLNLIDPPPLEVASSDGAIGVDIFLKSK